ncbi:uncharacterized protein VTP21DRAFT_9106 [Calcarisporiella thermophila]|uniref:uncharacterized protein n=1 Tax=Calcarisporiella thermophila TaxID=911321 RepID=UPI0037443A6E
MPHKRKKASIRQQEKQSINLEPQSVKTKRDAPRGFVFMMKAREIMEKKQREAREIKAAKDNKSSKDSKQGESKQNDDKEKRKLLLLQPGEKFSDFSKRVDEQMREEILHSVRQGRTTEKRRKYREKRKLAKLAKHDALLEEASARDFHQLHDEVKFGEVAPAPPTLTTPKARGAGKRTLEAKEQEEAKAYSSEEDELVKEVKARNNRKLKNMSMAARKQLESERERAIATYRAVKARKLAEKELQEQRKSLR